MPPTKFASAKSKRIKASLKRRFPNGRFGSLASNWKGGRRIMNAAGYIGIYNPRHPQATKDGYVMEHRLLMEKKIRRFLRKGEEIHHINGDKADNRLENLELVTRKQHALIHFNAVKEVAKLKKILDDNNIKY